MSTFDERWEKLKQRRPALCNDSARVEFRVDNLRTLLRAFYDAGGKDWKSVIDTLKGNERGRSDVEDLLRRMGL